MGWLLAAGGVSVVVVALGVVGYAGVRMGRLPDGNPAEVLGALPADRPVLVCLGDSIMQGELGADWVGELRERLGTDVSVVNAGVGGQITWDLRQRLDDVAQCQPDGIVLMVGSNDAVGALGGQWASYYASGRPQAPSEAWFAEQFDALVGELVLLTPKVVCLTLPALGEDTSTVAAGIVRRHNEVIRATAATHGADLLDVHPAMESLRDPAGRAVPFMSGVVQFVRWSLVSIIRHRVLGQSWDRIAQRRGLRISADTIHPSDRAGRVLVDLVERWAARELSGGSEPVGPSMASATPDVPPRVARHPAGSEIETT